MRIAVLTDSLADTDGVGRYTIRLMRAIEAKEPGTQIEVALARKHPGISSAVPKHWPVRVVLPRLFLLHVAAAILGIPRRVGGAGAADGAPRRRGPLHQGLPALYMWDCSRRGSLGNLA